MIKLQVFVRCEATCPPHWESGECRPVQGFSKKVVHTFSELEFYLLALYQWYSGAFTRRWVRLALMSRVWHLSGRCAPRWIKTYMRWKKDRLLTNFPIGFPTRCNEIRLNRSTVQVQGKCCLKCWSRSGGIEIWAGCSVPNEASASNIFSFDINGF